MMTEELVRAAAAGDQDAFAQLVRLYENKVYSLALRMCGEDAAEGAELRRAVAAGLARLSDDHRQVLVLRELQELSYEEIARMLDIDLGTVKSRISRARSALRRILLESGNLSGYLPSNTAETRKGGRP